MAARARRAGAGCAQNGPQRPQEAVSGRDPTTDTRVASTGRLYRLWFPARRTTAPAGLTKSGKPKRKPPGLPPNVNERRNMTWKVERGVIGYWRLLAKTVAQYEGIPPLARVRISVIVRRRALGVADEDGDASRAKPLVDGLRDAKVIRNDTRDVVTWGTCTEERMGAEGPGIVLVVEEIS